MPAVRWEDKEIMNSIDKLIEDICTRYRDKFHQCQSNHRDETTTFAKRLDTLRDVKSELRENAIKEVKEFQDCIGTLKYEHPDEKILEILNKEFPIENIELAFKGIIWYIMEKNNLIKVDIKRKSSGSPVVDELINALDKARST